MGSVKGQAAQPAFMEEADESGEVLHETKISAVAPDPPSPREKANSKKSRHARHSPSSANQTDSDSTTVMSPTRSRKDKETRPKGKEKDRMSDRDSKERDREEKQHKRNSSRPTTVTFKSDRPTAKHAKTSPVVHTSSRKSQESEYYGVAVSQQPHRERSHTHSGRAMTYHGGYHPPQANTQFYMSHQAPLAPPPYNPQHAYGVAQFGTSYPSPANGPVPPIEQHYEQLRQRNLKQRFETGPRPASAMGNRPQSKSLYEREHEEDAAPRRRPSLKKRESDRERMPPPPPRPKTTKPEKMAFRPAPPQVHRTRHYDGDLYVTDAAVPAPAYPDPRRLSGDYGALYPQPHALRPVVYYTDPVTGHGLQPAVSHRPRSRPQSFLGPVPLDYEYGSAPHTGYGVDKYDDELRTAEQYQNQAASATPLTKDALQRASRRSHGGSSRSTRSSESRDESDYRHSVTTRTTRSISGEDDVTIKLPANSIIEVQGTKIQCRDGGEVNISTSRAGGGGGGGGSHSSSSDKDSIVYEERPSRAERPAPRGRTMSQSSPYSTRMPFGYDPHMYSYPQPNPPYY
jgi:hypothetical protein